MIAGRGIRRRPGRRRFSRAETIVLVVFAGGVLIRIFFLLDYRPAFLGDTDAGTYIDAARRSLFENVYDPAGYPLFIRVLHGIDPQLSVLILVQHCLGIASATLMYLLVRRVTGSLLLGLVPAVLILFDGYGLWVEHTPITESLFSFLVVSALFVAVRALEGTVWLLVGAGLLVAAAGVVRPVGLMLLPVLVVWGWWARGEGARAGLLASAALLAPACVLVGTYLAIESADTGYSGLTYDSGRVLYARVAKFADCSQFTPPARTRALCERTPSAKRGSFNQYLTGFPDHARGVTLAGRSISPAWRVFGSPPGGNSELTAFAWAAIIHQPLDYLDAVASDFHYYWADDHRPFIAAAARVDPGVDRVVAAYYGTHGGVSSLGLGFARWYGRTVEVTGVLMIILLLMPLAGFFADDPRARRVAVLLACTGWLLPLVSDAVASVDPRFILPSYGPLAAASVMGWRGVRARWARPLLGSARATPRND